MIRRSPLRLAVAAAATTVALSGCATFNDTDVAARVEGVELTEAQLASLVRETTGDDAVRAPLDAANQAITAFVLDESLRADLDRLGASAPRPDNDELTTASLQESFTIAFGAWQATPPQTFSEDEWSRFYSRGPVESGVTCTAHILVETEAEAFTVLDELDSGVPFAQVAAVRSIDPGSKDSGGVLPCASTGDFANSYIPEYVEPALAAEIGVPVGPAQSQYGYHIILVRPFESIDSAELEALLTNPTVRFELASTDLDIYINPRYGSFEGARGIVALGG